MRAYQVDAVPFEHEKMNEWRDRGIFYLHESTNFLVMGKVDDAWVNPKGELLLADYKATAKDGEVNLDAPWQISYKRQMELYQWLFRQNGFQVSNTGYFVYCNGNMDKEAFDAKLEFKVKVIPYQGNATWVEKELANAKACLMADVAPAAHPECDFCQYRAATRTVEKS